MFLHTLLVVLTDRAAHLLGSAAVRQHFHLLLSALLMFGPALSFWVSQHSVFARRSHFLYRWDALPVSLVGFRFLTRAAGPQTTSADH